MGMRMDERSTLYAAVYEAVETCVALECCVPAATASVQRALSRLRGPGGDAEAVRQLESMSVLLHQLTAASMRPQRDMRAAALSQLDFAARQWMARLPIQ